MELVLSFMFISYVFVVVLKAWFKCWVKDKATEKRNTKEKNEDHFFAYLWDAMK